MVGSAARLFRAQRMAESTDLITVLNVIDTGGPGGAETVFLHTASSLDPSRFRSVAVVSREGWLADSLRARGIEPIVLCAEGSFHFNYLRELLRLIARHRVDVIAAHLYGSAVYCSLAGLIAHVPVISVLHGQSDIAGRGRLAAIKKAIVRRISTRVVFVSARLRDELAPALGLQPEKCAVIPNGIDTSRYSVVRDVSIRRELNLLPEHVLVGAVGNIRRPKSYEILLHAARILIDRSAHYRFAIAGEGSGPLYEQLLELRAKLKLEGVLHFLGLRSDVPTVMRNFDIYALSSSTEGFSIACLEAMASGTPIVATRSGGPQEILKDEHTGLLVPTGDPAALADAIARLANDRPLAAAIAERALGEVKSRFELSSTVSAYEELFRQVAARSQGSRSAH